MEGIQKAVDGILESEVDLLSLAQKEDESFAADPLRDLFVAAAQGLDFSDLAENADDWKPPEEIEKNLERIAKPRIKATNFRRRIFDTLIAETGGTGKLSTLRLNRGWNVDSIDGLNIITSIINEAYLRWLSTLDNLDILRAVRKSDEFRAARKQYGRSLQTRDFLFGEVEKRIGTVD